MKAIVRQQLRLPVWVILDRGGQGPTFMHARFAPKATLGRQMRIRLKVPTKAVV
jgi:hypothetical protein